MRMGFGWLLSVVAALLMSIAATQAAPVTPPQGYIGLDLPFSVARPVYYDGTQRGFYNLDYEFTLGMNGSALAGTFWAFNFSFGNSTGQLPANHVNRDPLTDQGGYVGVQIRSATESIAIFSIWWAVGMQAGPGASCVSADESWVTDSGKVAGGPFRSCRLPIALTKGVRYRIRLAEIGNALKPNQAEWWGAWLINTQTGTEKLIGRLQTRGAWGWLNTGTGGFIEHFGPMPRGCGSIPKSQSRFFVAKADYGAFVSRVGAYTYGACAGNISGRSTISCAATSSCQITVR